MLSAGWPIPEKGVNEFYEAMRLLSRSLPRLCAIWIGAGEGLSGLRRRAREDGLSERLLLPGYVPRREDVMRYMAAADVLAFPSHDEGLPNVVVEAMACGLPVVASAVGGIPEIVADGVTGRLVPARDAPALAGAVRGVLEAPQPTAEMAARARDLVQRCFSGRSNGLVAAEVLRRVAAGTHAGMSLPACANVPPGRMPMETLAGGSVQ
jgi:glycosyltransferase involved in cell wall biosynthesis